MVWGLLVFAAVLLPIVLDVLGHRVGVVGFEPIVEHFENAASEFAQPVLEGVLKLPRRFWRDGLKQERLHQLANSLELRLSGDSRFFPDALHVLGNQAYQKRENRLRSCIEASFPGYVFVLLLKPEYSCRRRLYFVRPISTAPPLNQTTPKKHSILPFSHRVERLHPSSKGIPSMGEPSNHRSSLLQVLPSSFDVMI